MNNVAYFAELDERISEITKLRGAVSRFRKRYYWANTNEGRPFLLRSVRS